MDEEIRILAVQLAESLRKGEGAMLEPRSVIVALSALRAYVKKRSAPEADKSPETFQIELMDDQGLSGQILATTRDPVIARAALDEAKKRRPGAKIVLRPASGKRQNPHDQIAVTTVEAGGLPSSLRLPSKFAKSR